MCFKSRIFNTQVRRPINTSMPSWIWIYTGLFKGAIFWTFWVWEHPAVDVGFDNACTVFRRWNICRFVPRLYGWLYKTLPISVWTKWCGYECENESYVEPIFDSCFIKFLFRISDGINCWDPLEDSDTGGPSSITVRMEYWRAFQYWYCKLCVGNR